MSGISRAAKRIQRQLRDIKQSKEISESGISVDIVHGDVLSLRAVITGPKGTPYEGGNFVLAIKVPEAYPFKPVDVRFLTKIWHPNISSVTGAICLNILKEDWVPYMPLRAVLLCVQALLSAPEPDDPQDAVVAKQYKENKEMFKLTAEYWTKLYAGAPEPNTSR